jgi:RNA polymerase sigma-70 factor (ECF subfamily)
MASTQPLHALLDQTGWIHALARRLVADPHLAADLAQDTTVDALERRPDASRPLRAWLAAVMRTRLAKLRRGETNRAARERARGSSELEPAALDVVERAETHRNVVLAVLALDEPYRSTLLMRFFEQLSYDEIARRNGLTRAAVNSRVTRALEQLRGRLETTYRGDRRALGLALIPLAKLPTGVATTTNTLLGLKTMHVALGTAAATLLAATVSVGVFGSGREPARPGRLPFLASAPEEVELQTPFFEPVAEPAERVSLVLPLQDHQDEHRRRQQREKDSDQNTWRTEVAKTMALAPTVESLSVNTGSGDVEVLAAAGPSLEIVARVRARLGTVKESELTQVFEDHVDVYEEDGRLMIEDKHNNTRGWSVSFVVSVPGRLPLHANSGSGDVTVRAGRGEVNANTGSGDVRVELPLERLERLNANSGSGDVTVEVTSVEDELSANSGSGDVTARVAEASSPGRASLNSGSGDIVLVVPANVVGSFELKTHGGDIEVPRSLGLEIRKDVSGQKVARGTLGSGGGKYKLSSGSGDLKVLIGHALPKKDE